MIVQWLMDFLHGLLTVTFDALRAMLPSPPGFLADLNGAIDSTYGQVPGPIKWFLPIGPLITIGVAVVGILVVLGLIRFARRVLSLLTGGGGNA